MVVDMNTTKKFSVGKLLDKYNINKDDWRVYLYDNILYFIASATNNFWFLVPTQHYGLDLFHSVFLALDESILKVDYTKTLGQIRQYLIFKTICEIQKHMGEVFNWLYRVPDSFVRSRGRNSERSFDVNFFHWPCPEKHTKSVVSSVHDRMHANFIWNLLNEIIMQELGSVDRAIFIWRCLLSKKKSLKDIGKMLNKTAVWVMNREKEIIEKVRNRVKEFVEI